jgi:hypothetical protein
MTLSGRRGSVFGCAVWAAGAVPFQPAPAVLAGAHSPAACGGLVGYPSGANGAAA